MKFKTKEPLHWTLSTSGKPFKGFMNQYPLVVTGTQGSWIDKTDIRTSPQQNFLDKDGKGGSPPFQLHKAVIGYKHGKQMR